MEWKLELVLLPVADVDRAKAFYAEQMGFVEIVDWQKSDDFRIVQLTPPGSACAIGFGAGITDAAPGSVRGLHLVVADIVAACDELRGRGVHIASLRHTGAAGWADGPHPERSDYSSFAEFADPDGNTWLLQERGFSAS
jgi:catechol 2,3-dioxygenase-like lactoylglutathione lyase family enzyme